MKVSATKQEFKADIPTKDRDHHQEDSSTSTTRSVIIVHSINKNQGPPSLKNPMKSSKTKSTH